MTGSPQGLSRDVVEGRLVENIVYFARALRNAGMRVGPAQVETALRAVEAAGFTRRDDFYHVLRATMVSRAEQLEVFHQVFALFWRDPDLIAQMIHMMSPQMRDDTAPKARDAAHRRAAEALGDPPARPPRKEQTEVEMRALMTASERAVLRGRDFEQMSGAELREAEAAIRALDLDLPPLATRRARPAPRGRPDPRATLRQAMRRGGEVQRLARRAPEPRRPDLVALCDISGSMSVYSRMLLRFLHALAHAEHRRWGQVHAFTFGTALTNVSRALAKGEPDAALAAIGQEARDWEGGTRIGAGLARFNRDWSRRVLGRGAVVLLITDGLERGETDRLATEAERLHLSCRRLIWLNPLLRWEGFAPKAAGIRALMPHVDAFHACHSLDSLADLTAALGGAQGVARRRDMQAQAMPHP
ncbi:MAG: VWA domain-containing protein [Paracoccaceae bacterium]|nr:VWA domain-containing protein [Paracoccaceae bacterium]